MKKSYFLLALTAVILFGCGQKAPHTDVVSKTDIHAQLPGDSARYGLACDGCTDSVLVLLPYSGEDPDTFDIINAWQQHRIYGMPHIGDEMAVIINPEDRDEALAVINVGTLAQSWRYMVSPTLRNVENMPQRMQRRMINEMQKLPDSIKQQWFTPREYGLNLKNDHSAIAIGGMRKQTTTDDMSPIEFPTPRRYTEWHLWNGKLILHADTIRGFSEEGDLPYTDTATIVFLRPDSLVLQIGDTIQQYYLKKEQ